MGAGKTVCFTGHRHILGCDKAALAMELAAEVERQIGLGALVFRAGGALGFDTMAALAVLRAKEAHPEICLELVLPCPEQAEKWSERDRVLYQTILATADSHRYISTFYYSGLLQQRNRALVAGADICIAYLNSSHGGGTAFTSALALREGLEYINLADRVHARVCGCS